MAEATPMMQQYLEAKEQCEDCILFFRLGDFYEMFADDARLVSRELDLTLTTRDRGKENPDERVPMCGVPYHSSEAYIARLIARGYKVAICEQMEDPALAKGLVKREIIRVVTPGTVVDASMLEEGRSNYICAVYLDHEGGAAAFADVSTGEVCAAGFRGEGASSHLVNELGRFRPAEAVLSDAAWENEDLTVLLRDRLGCRRERGGEARFLYANAAAAAVSQFGEAGLSVLPPAQPEPLMAVGGLLGYLHETQKTGLAHLGALQYYTGGRFLELDPTARRNLELTETLRSGEKRGSLLWVLDRTKTAMGSRLLRAWLERPLLDPVEISRRQKAVAALKDDAVAREELALCLRDVTDLERLIARVVYGSANCRDLASLSSGAAPLPRLKELLAPLGASSALLRALTEELDDLSDLRARIDGAICDSPPLALREGGFIRDGYDAEVDRLRTLMNGGQDAVAAIEAAEREKTGIRTLRVGYNKVFGYYLEVSKAYYDLVPDAYIRKQTLANCERFITQELKDLEHTILTAKDSLAELEYRLFCDLRASLAAEVARIQRTAAAVARADVLRSLAEVAAAENYCAPSVDCSDAIEITAGRHPVVEKTLRSGLFVPNDTRMDGGENLLSIITGPNMAGKSTYMRQVALIVLLAQIGSFVPAKAARIGIVDRIFTRIGAADDLASGQSTFMVEMTEVADILKNATEKSLLILDEIGRGTSTYDGMSIARAVLEHCADRRRLGAKTLFATHYHELSVLENELPNVKNYNIAARKRGEDIIFLRKIVRGGADRSYGIEVAKLAGVPQRVISRANALLCELEAQHPAPQVAAAPRAEQVTLGEVRADELARRLRNADITTMTPIEAMNFLYELKKLLN